MEQTPGDLGLREHLVHTIHDGGFEIRFRMSGTDLGKVIANRLEESYVQGVRASRHQAGEDNGRDPVDDAGHVHDLIEVSRTGREGPVNEVVADLHWVNQVDELLGFEDEDGLGFSVDIDGQGFVVIFTFRAIGVFQEGNNFFRPVDIAWVIFLAFSPHGVSDCLKG